MVGYERIAVIVLVVAAVGAVAAPAAAQTNPIDTPTPTPTPETGTERIDQNTVLVDSEWRPETSEIAITIRSETLQPITVTDAGAFMQGGEVAQRTVTVSAGNETTITIPGTKYRGFVGASIATTDTLYAEPIEIQQQWFGGAANWGLVRIAGAGGAVGILISTALIAYWKRKGGRQEIHEVA